MNNNYNKKLKGFARANRKNMTKAEACLWKYVLKNRNLDGYKFLRQRSIENYIVDFCCLELKLIIEVDGITHDNSKAREKDINRENNLKKLGYNVIRFQDQQILKNLDGVRLILLDIISKIKS